MQGVFMPKPMYNIPNSTFFRQKGPEGAVLQGLIAVISF